MNIFKSKTVEEVLDSVNNKGLKKTLTLSTLFMLGLGAIIGTGIFGMTGVAAVNMSGPAVMLSYALAGLTAIFIAFAYTEIAAMIPSSGGAYSYAYVAFGEIIAWLVSWMLIMYFLTSASSVAICWAGYMVSMLSEAGIMLPKMITAGPSNGGFINLPASLIVFLVASILLKGTRESAKLNTILVTIKIIAISLFVFIAIPHFDLKHWFEHSHQYDQDLFLSSKFIPFGISGIVSGAAYVFFAYNGFDAIASAAEETENPKRDLTIAIIGSLLVCIVLYMLVSSLLVGILPFNLIDINSPLASALSHNGHRLVSSIISAGVVIGMLSVIIVQLFALSRTILVTARDGLLPSFMAKIHPIHNTPYTATLIPAVIVAFLAGFVPLEILGTISSFGALFSFMTVCISLMVLRKKYPELNRPFRCPAVYFVGSVGVILCLVLLSATFEKVGFHVIIWSLLGLAFYFTRKFLTK